MRVSRRGLLGGAAGAAAVASVVPALAVPPPAAGRRPNMLVVLLDDVGYADLGCYGSEIATPNIDALAGRGVRFRNFHTAPLCSPTRAALLTGRNPHSVGVGSIADWATDNPGYRGFIDPSVRTLPEMLGAAGYGCYAAGKWHLTPIADQGPTGPFRHWPTQRGFERWYGYAGAMADQYHPELFDGTSAIDPPPRADYHLSADLADHMIGYLADHVASASNRPFFGYLALGACHWPQQVPAADIARQRGRYDGGWSRLRQTRFVRQRAIGLLPADVRLPPENPDVPAWDGLPAADRAFAARCMEVYAAFLSHADAQVGRVLRALDELGVGDDTIVVLLSDNGATAEGTTLGAADMRGMLYIDKESAADRAEALALLGGADSFPVYPLGWAAAGNTPLRWYKSTTHEGGIRTPLIVSWPGGGIGGGPFRPQFHHVSDVAPTLLELAGLSDGGCEGTSLAYALRRPDAPTAKTAQLFECTGSRAIWAGGWKAVARHVQGGPFAADRWELYDLDRDFAEADDCATAEPARLAALQARWLALAEAGRVLPLDDRRRRALPPPPARCRLIPGGSRVDRLLAPDAQAAHRIVADVVLARGDEGVILTAGTALRGYELFVKDGELHYTYLFSRTAAYTMRAGRLPRGACRLAVELGDGRGPRTARLLVDGQPRATIAIPRSWPGQALGAGLRCGANRGAPVSRAYRGAFPFTGRLRHVDIEPIG